MSVAPWKSAPSKAHSLTMRRFSAYAPRSTAPRPSDEKNAVEIRRAPERSTPPSLHSMKVDRERSAPASFAPARSSLGLRPAALRLGLLPLRARLELLDEGLQLLDVGDGRLHDGLLLSFEAELRRVEPELHDGRARLLAVLLRPATRSGRTC